MTQMTSELSRDVGTRKRAKVTVTASPLNRDPWVSFTTNADFPDGGGKQDGDKLKFEKGAGAFELSFHLRDETTLDLAFLATVEEAMWVAVGTAKPTEPGLADGIIKPDSVDAKKLVVINANANPETLNYILRFDGNSSTGGHPPYVLDPIIINGVDRI